ncbi:MAG TPA: hypothetical protein VEK05_09430 [Burkholderiales bacterium]|nr:hypothetical protein [Burkholderiales bacterium]
MCALENQPRATAPILSSRVQLEGCIGVACGLSRCSRLTDEQANLIGRHRLASPVLKELAKQRVEQIRRWRSWAPIDEQVAAVQLLQYSVGCFDSAHFSCGASREVGQERKRYEQALHLRWRALQNESCEIIEHTFQHLGIELSRIRTYVSEALEHERYACGPAV